MGLPAFPSPLYGLEPNTSLFCCCTEQHPRTSAPVPGSESVRRKIRIDVGSSGKSGKSGSSGEIRLHPITGYPIPVLSFSAFPVLLFTSLDFQLSLSKLQLLRFQIQLDHAGIVCHQRVSGIYHLPSWRNTGNGLAIGR